MTPTPFPVPTFRGHRQTDGGTALPTIEWLTSGWNSACVNVFNDFGFNTEVVASVTSLSFAPVPEPETAVLLLLGLATVWVRSAARHR